MVYFYLKKLTRKIVFQEWRFSGFFFEMLYHLRIFPALSVSDMANHAV